jgi:hypothetical protein
MEPTLYEIIGVSPDAGIQEIEAACLRLGNRYHPDKNPGDKNAARMFALFEQAFSTLLDPGSREAYDKSIGLSTPANEDQPTLASESPSRKPKESSAPEHTKTRTNATHFYPNVGKWKIPVLMVLSASLILGSYFLWSLKSSNVDLQIKGATTDNVMRSPIDPACIQAVRELRAFHTRWDDGAELANSTQRIALAPVIADLQRIKQSIERLPVPPCALLAQMHISEYMQKRIDGYLSFLRSGSEPLSNRGDEALWEYQLELTAIERGCSEICKQEIRIERQAQKVKEAISAEKKRIENSAKYEEETIDRLLQRVKDQLHNPSTARFENLLRNKKNDALCGTLIAIGGTGKEVRETFAVKNFGQISVGYVYLPGIKPINDGYIEAQKLCPPEGSEAIIRR